MRVSHHAARWQGLDPSLGLDPTGLLSDPNMALALARAGQGGLLLPQGARRSTTQQQLLSDGLYTFCMHEQCLEHLQLGTC